MERGFSSLLKNSPPFTLDLSIPAAYLLPSCLFLYLPFYPLQFLNIITQSFSFCFLRSMHTNHNSIQKCLLRCPSLTFKKLIIPFFPLYLQSFPNQDDLFKNKYIYIYIYIYIPLHCKIYCNNFPLTSAFPLNFDSLIIKFLESIVHVHCFYLCIIHTHIFKWKSSLWKYSP